MLFERHPDPTVDTVRLDRLVATAVAAQLPRQRAADLIEALDYSTPEALRKGHERARRRLADLPDLRGVISRTLDIAT